MALGPEPIAGDDVIENEGARIFVPSETATLLAEQELDAATTEQGTGFTLRPQSDAPLHPAPAVRRSAAPCASSLTLARDPAAWGVRPVTRPAPSLHARPMRAASIEVARPPLK